MDDRERKNRGLSGVPNGHPADATAASKMKSSPSGPDGICALSFRGLRKPVSPVQVFTSLKSIRHHLTMLGVNPSLILVTLLQIPSSMPPTVPLLEECSAGSRTVATITPGTELQVHWSLAGDSSTCYGVSAVVEGKDVKGYVIGQVLPEIVAFERQRAATPQPRVQPVRNESERPPAARYPAFGDFSAIDAKNKRFVLSETKGKITLVCFWSPLVVRSGNELLEVNRVAARWRGKGLAAVGVSLDLEREEVLEALEDLRVNVPVVTDPHGVAARHGISGNQLPYTFVLNERQEIIAAGLHERELESAVERLMSQK